MEFKEYNQVITTTIHAEVRKVEMVEGDIVDKETKAIKNHYKYLVISCDDDEGNRIYFKDKNIENEPIYTRGTMGTVHFRITGNLCSRMAIDFLKFELDEKSSRRG